MNQYFVILCSAFRLLSTGRDTASVTAGFATAFFFLLLGRGVLAIVLAVPDACACARPVVARGCCILTDPYPEARGRCRMTDSEFRLGRFAGSQNPMGCISFS